MLLKFVLAIGLASSASAMPAAQAPAASAGIDKRQDDMWKDIIDPWGVYGSEPVYASGQVKRSDDININDRDENVIDIGGLSYKSDDILEHVKRATTADFVNYIPNCKVDPSNSDTPKPQWPVNHGIKIPKSGDNDQCTTGDSNAQHCWTEYYLVEAAIEYKNWQSTGTVLQCDDKDGSICSVSIADLKQTCAITGTVTSDGWDQKMVDISVGLTVGKDDWPLGAKPNLGYGYSYTKTHSVAENDLLNRCAGQTTTVTCTWEKPKPLTEENRGDLCHQVWYADRVQHVWGQMQRVCNKCSRSDQIVQQNTPSNGKCVRGQKEFDFLLPINKLVSCAGRCNDKISNLPMPPNTERRPYEQPDWNSILVSPKLKPEDADGTEIKIT